MLDERRGSETMREKRHNSQVGATLPSAVSLLLIGMSISCSKVPASTSVEVPGPKSLHSQENLQLEGPANKDLILVSDPIILNFDKPFVLNGLKADKVASIQSVHKITRDISFFYASEATSYMYDRTLENRMSGNIDLLESLVADPEGQRVYTLQNGAFWSIGPDVSLARSRPPEPNQLTVPVVQFKNAFQNAGITNAKTIFVDNFRVISTDSLSISVVERNAQSSKFSQLDLKIPGGTESLPIYAAGLGSEIDQFWFLRKGEMLFLHLKEGSWIWSKAPFSIQVNGAPLDTSPKSLAVIIKFDGEKRSVVGGAIIQTQSGFLSNESVTPLYVEKSFRAQADNSVMPEFKDKCVACHADLTSMANIKTQAKTLVEKLESFSMPPATAAQLNNVERAAMVRWLRAGFIQ